MLKWIPFAMVRIAAFFTAGVLLAIYFPNLFQLQFAATCSGALVVCYFLVVYFMQGRARALGSGFLGLLAILFLGYAHLMSRTDRNGAGFLLSVSEPITAYSAIVRSAPESKAKSWKVELEVTAIKTTNWQERNAKVLLYISKKAGAISWQYGDHVLIKGSPQPLRPPANPGEFDFKRFLGFKNIYHQQFALPNQIEWVATTERKGFIYYSHRARAWAQKKINQYVIGEQEQAIAAALVLGVTEGIDTDLLNAYAASGAMHVLAVSGLHVGIIYAILLFLLKPLNRFAWSRWAVAVLSLLCLWVFAFVTGLSPSVLRAVVMFSFVALARPFGQRTNIYNTLAASAFVLLLYNPYLIMSVGFQLSYLAVLGIVYLQRPIYNLWEVHNRLGDWVWQITCVSIAAQLATFSLGLLYFHQFPVYFLISNLFVIPLSTGVLVFGILALALSFIAPVSFLIGKLLTAMIHFLNWTVFTTEKLPFSLISDIHITTAQCWLLMGVLFGLLFLFEFRKAKWLYGSFIFALFFAVMQWQHFSDSVKRSLFVVYSISNHRAFEFMHNGKSYFVADSAILGDEDRLRFHVRPNRLLNGIAQVHGEGTIPFMQRTQNLTLFAWRGKTVAHISQRQKKLPLHFQADYLIVSNNAFPLTGKMTHGKRIGQLILDGSNSRAYASKLIKFATQENIPFYSVMDQGAFTLTD